MSRALRRGWICVIPDAMSIYPGASMNPATLTRRSKIFRLGLSSVLLLGLAASPPARAQDAAAPQTTPTELVDAMNQLFGKQTYGRAIHAKGIVLSGSFTPSSDARKLSKATHLQGGKVPVLVRFSSFAGIPMISDVDKLASPRGMAIKFQLLDGSETDIVSHSFNGFPSPTAAEFTQLLQALGTSPPGAPSPTPAEKFLSTHPVAVAFLTTQAPPPVSFATMRYFGVNSFKFTNAAGKTRFGRYQIVPAAGEQALSNDALAKADKDYLEQEIVPRVASAPVRFTLQVQLAEGEDKIDDPSIAWPPTREVIKLGEITISKAVADSDADSRRLMFTPSALLPGIEAADPMIAMRGASYGVSYGRRHTP
ncbi:catalase family peroxidase [Paucibacter sp. R3-3]|uniref:Catalase-related peroxidase n=1 Tax=Roseateles agri TaxID=3098619 RepID=A0ABU5DTA2_9BURK|nr:catalase family peroxidase [Paucibacter sp. R3-3]MDY0749055.1 catalase family peroxidase [Paucibacter sp. R3-3]